MSVIDVEVIIGECYSCQGHHMSVIDPEVMGNSFIDAEVIIDACY